MPGKDDDKKEHLLDALVGKLSFVQAKEEQERIISQAIFEVFGRVSAEKKKQLVDWITSYELIEDTMKRPDVEDIMINGLNPIFMFTSKDGMTKTGKKFETLSDLNLFAKKLLVLSGKPRMEYANNFHLPEGSRANIVYSPMGAQITIRKFKQQPLSLINLIDNGTLTFELGALFWLYADGLRIKPANMVVVGMPGSGKTSLLNALFSFFPPNERIIVIEDTMELNTEANENCARLETTEDLTMKELVKNSLRMRPNRIVVGEVRGEEANDLLTAMNVGKICMGTLHASSAREAVMRLEHTPMNVPTDIIPLVDVFISLKQFYIEGELKRVVAQVTETGGLEKKVLLSDLVEFDPGSMKLVESHPTVIYRDRLASAAGISPKEIIEELKLRTDVLKGMSEKQINTIPKISEFIKLYYDDPDKALKKVGVE